METLPQLKPIRPDDFVTILHPDKSWRVLTVDKDTVTIVLPLECVKKVGPWHDITPLGATDGSGQ